jgi:pimeloyl-ACP methyl ester carboxylesterase
MAGFLEKTALGQAIFDRWDLYLLHQRGAGKSLLDEESSLEYVRRSQDDYRLPQYLADLEHFRRQVFASADARWDLVFGSSWGGNLGLSYLRCFPRAARSFVLGSFDASRYSTTLTPYVIESAIWDAMHSLPQLEKILSEIMDLCRSGSIPINDNGSRVLRLKDLWALIFPYLAAFDLEGLASLLRGVIKNDASMISKLKKVFADDELSIGATIPAQATYLLELVDRDLIATGRKAERECAFVDATWYGEAMRAQTLIFDARGSDGLSSSAAVIAQDGVMFAGRYDPLICWRSVAATAANLPSVRFHLLPGGHSPFRQATPAMIADVCSLSNADR